MRGLIVIVAALFLVACASAIATRDAAFKAYYAQDYTEAFKGFSSLAGQGDATSQLMLGYMYEGGFGPPADMRLATFFFARAASSGNVEAQAKMGDVEEWVYGDHAQALAWDKKASAVGNPMAEVNLYYLYKNGLGVEEDDAKAQAWLEKAAAQPVDSMTMYAAVTKAFINAQKFYPKSSVLAGSTGKVMIAFDYYGGGSAQNVVLDKSSGDPTLDDAGKQTVEQAVLPSLSPDLVKSAPHHIIVVINYNLTN